MSNFILDYLQQFFEELQPLEFYREIFPKGELAEKELQQSGKYNAIAVELQPTEEKKVNAKRYLITDDLHKLHELLESENFIIISPISYCGRSRESINARFIYAIAIDLDGITEQQHIRDLFYQMDNDITPLPTFTVFSGSGLHLYYQLKQPLPCFKNIIVQLAALKKELTKSIWNKYTTDLYKNVQIESLFQGFRLVGGITKDGVNRTRAFRTGEKVSIEYLNGFVDDKYKVKEYTYKSNLTLAAAKEKFPLWYEKRIIEQQPKGTWICKKDLFEWWKRQMMNGAKVGHRYYCCMVLAIYAKKCGISRQELEEYAFSIVSQLDKMTDKEDNHFTRADVLAALEMYNDNYIRFPINSIVNLTDIPIEKNKRNYRKQEQHLKIARATKEILIADGENVKGGRPSKEHLVKSWRLQFPNGTKAECIKDLQLSKKTVYKYWV